MVPVGGYEDVTALDILPIQLLRRTDRGRHRDGPKARLSGVG